MLPHRLRQLSHLQMSGGGSPGLGSTGTGSTLLGDSAALDAIARSAGASLQGAISSLSLFPSHSFTHSLSLSLFLYLSDTSRHRDPHLDNCTYV